MTDINYDPNKLSETLSHSPIDIEHVRDQVATSLPMRWSEMSLELEAFRLNCSDQNPDTIEDWVPRHKLGRAFFHYIFACHYHGIRPSLGGFEKALSVKKPNQLKSSFYRMWNDWLDAGWMDGMGNPSSEVLYLHALRCFEVSTMPAMRTLISHMSAFVSNQLSRERDRVRDLKNVLQIKKTVSN